MFIFVFLRVKALALKALLTCTYGARLLRFLAFSLFCLLDFCSVNGNVCKEEITIPCFPLLIYLLSYPGVHFFYVSYVSCNGWSFIGQRKHAGSRVPT